MRNDFTASEPLAPALNEPAGTRAPTSETDRAYRLVRQAILSGTLAPGVHLRAATLRDQFAIGLTPIRETLVRLAAEGLVIGAVQRGFRVRDASLAEFIDLMDTRREIERACLARSIARGDAAWESRIVAAFHLLSRTPLPQGRGAGNAADLWETRHREFHRALVAACDSPWRLQLWTTLADHSERYRKLRLLRRSEPAAQVRDLDGEHRQLMEATLARNTKRACHLMEDHLQATEQAVTRLLTPQGSATPPARALRTRRKH